MTIKLNWRPPKGKVPFQTDVRKHASPVHPGTGSSQKPHGNWADEGKFSFPNPEARQRWEKTRESAVDREYAKRIFNDFVESADLKNAVPWIRIGHSDLKYVFEAGRFKTQFETGYSGGWYYPEERDMSEDNMFGDLGDDRPIYGYLSHDTALFDGKDSYYLNMYGDVAVKLKPEKRGQTTWTFGDSYDMGLEGMVAPSLVTDPQETSIGYPTAYATMQDSGTIEGLTGMYLEAQIHGGVEVSDIAEIHVLDLRGSDSTAVAAGFSATYFKDREAIFNDLKSKGVPIFRVGADGKATPWE